MRESREEGWLESWAPPACMVLTQLFLAGMILLSKVVISDGMLVFVLLAYRSLSGALVILPLALHFERDAWKNLDLKSLCWISLSAFLGYSLPVALFYYGLYDVSSSYSAIVNGTIPVMTYILAILLRIEKLEMCKLAGNMRILGTLGCFGGTLLVTLYKGEVFHVWHAVIKKNIVAMQKDKSSTNQLRGTLLIMGCSFVFAFWYLIQSKVVKAYPYKYWSSVMTCLLGGIQTGVVGIMLRRDANSWHLGWNLQLLTIIYSGSCATAIKYIWNSYAVEKRGPSYPAMFNGLVIVFTAFLGSLFLGDDLTVGSIVGTIVTIGGLYMFFWGKKQDVHHANSGEERYADNTNVEDSSA